MKMGTQIAQMLRNIDLRRSFFSICVHLARATKAVKREDVMRDDLTFHVLRITPAANSANIAAEIFFASTDNFIF